jgi:hypothetical protein
MLDSNGIDRMVFARLFEEGNQALNFADGLFVGFASAGLLVEYSVDQDGDRLRNAVENQEFVSDQKVHGRGPQIIVRRAGHDRLHVMDEFVTDETDSAAGETRQPGQGHRSIPFQHLFDHLKSVLHTLRAIRIRFARDGKFLNHFAAFDQFYAVCVLTDHGAWIAANERITPEMLAAFDGLKEKRFALSADFAVSRQRRFEVREQAPSDGNQISAPGQLYKFAFIGKIHNAVRRYLTRMASQTP